MGFLSSFVASLPCLVLSPYQSFSPPRDQEVLQPSRPHIPVTNKPSIGAWPSISNWQAFNVSLNGRLRETTPWALPCYLDKSGEECNNVSKQYAVAESRSSVYGAMQDLQFESCGPSNCQLNALSPDSNITGECDLGRLSAYHVEARDSSDVVFTINFVRDHEVPLSIKNTGHDYFGRSSAPNSLGLWTHNLKDLSYHSSFTPFNCPNKAPLSNIGVIGAGITAGEAVSYFQNHSMHITVGAAPSVGIAGGFAMGGGHGPLAPSYGLMVDQAVEFDVVTASGQLLTINECNHPDLFWAMRGGGGGTFAVLLNLKIQLHEAIPMNIHFVEAEIRVNETETETSGNAITKYSSHRDIATALALNQPSWSQNRVAGYNFFFPDKFMSILILPSDDPHALPALTAQWSAFLTSYKGISIAENAYKRFDTYTEMSAFVADPKISKNGLTGVGIAESSRLIPREQFTGLQNITELVDAFLEGLQISFEKGGDGIEPGSGQIYATTPANTPDAGLETSVNPAWRKALWHVVYPGLYLNNLTLSQTERIQDSVGKAVEPLKKLTKEDGGCYLNEGDWKEEDWRKTFFGGNYDELSDVKGKWDPQGVFRCWKCVGWEEEMVDEDVYSCYGQGKSGWKPTIPRGSV